MGALSQDMGRAFQISPDAIVALDALRVGLDLSSSDLSSLIKQFDIMGIGVEEATGEIEEMSKVARGMGLNVSKFMGSVASNLKMANTFKFRDGVQGFTRMAAQAQRLHFDMSQISKMATDLFDPEAAIDMAANFQIMGGAMGDLTDPFRLMYLATNDIGGLQDAIVGAAEASVMFNEETGEFDISSTELRRMKAMADQLGMSLEDFVTAAKKSKQHTMAMKQMGTMELIDPKSGEDMKEFAANMAQMKGGRFIVTLPDGIGEVALEDIDTTEELDALRKLQTQEGLSTRKISLNQLSAQERIANATEALVKGVTFEAMGDEKAPIRKYTDQFLSAIESTIGGPIMKQVATQIAELGGAIAEAVVTGEEKNLERVITRTAENLERLSTSLDETLMKDLPLLGTFFQGLMTGTASENSEIHNDFISRPGQRMGKFSGKDIVVGFKEENLQAMPSMTEMNSAVNTFNTQNQYATTRSGPIDINLNMNGRAQLDLQGITTDMTAQKLQEVMGAEQFQLWLMSQVGERIAQGGNAFQSYGTTT